MPIFYSQKVNVKRLTFSATQQAVTNADFFLPAENLFSNYQKKNLLFSCTNSLTLSPCKMNPGKLWMCSYVLPFMASFTQG